MSERQRVAGIGGVFFRARDPEALTAWYARTLGVGDPAGPGMPWEQRGGYTVWSGFDVDTDYFGRRDQQWMINFRVDDLDALLAQLRADGVEVLDKVEDYEFGRFGWAVDPEGNRFELWQPAAPPATAAPAGADAAGNAGGAADASGG